MSVVRRCPSCGTTQATSGVCEACHEADVRYHCTNHTPGVWLDGTSCPHCGARLGAPTREKSTAPPPPVRRPAPPPVAARPRGPATAARPSSRPPFAPAPMTSSPPAVPRSTRRVVIEDASVETYPARISPWQRLFEAALRARVAKRERGPAGAGVARNLTGCLLRLMLVAFVLFVMLVSALFLFGHSLMLGNEAY